MAARGSNSLWPWLGVALAVVLLDQITKTIIAGTMQLGDVRTITPFFDIVRAHNRGAAFSFLSDASGWQRWFFTGIGVLAAGFIDLIIETDLNPHDIVPLMPIIAGSGGIITTWDNGPAQNGGRIVAAGDQRVHQAALEMLARG